MTLTEFADTHEDLKDSVIMDKWKNLIEHLSELDIDDVKNILDEGLDFISFEANDGFGTEGLSL